MDELTVAIVHYHLRPGGVTRVIESTVAALSTHATRTIVLSGGPAPSGPLAPAIAVASLGYDVPHSPDTVLTDCVAAAVHALGREPDIWHIHNHALGKNTALTAAVALMAQRGMRLLLQLHDFAEDGRPANYARLRSLPAESAIYPSASHVHYALLNRRDLDIVRRAGGDPAATWFLPNPVLPFDDASDPVAEPGATVVYPTRAIRRKNIGEFLLWAALAEDGSRFETTLAPTSTEDLPVYEQWKDLARDLGLPVQFEVGMRGDRTYAQIIRDARTIMSTSVAEGFGLAFLEPWLASRPVIGRDLPDVTQDFRDAGIALDGLYPSLPIPVAWIGESLLRETIRQRVTAFLAAYGRPPLDGLYEAFVEQDVVDFGRLDEAMQATIIRKVRADPAARDRVREQSSARLAGSDTAMDGNQAVIASHYGLETYGRRLLEIYSSMMKKPVGTCSRIDANVVLDSFLKPGRLSLLRM